MAFHRDIHRLGAKHGAHGDAAGQGLGHTEQIRLHKLFAGEEGAGPPKPRLHFIHDEKDSLGVAKISHCTEKVLVSHSNAPFALDRFQDHGGRVFGYGLLEFCEVVVGTWVMPSSMGSKGF